MSAGTETEAAKRWCPFAVEASDGLCMGSACMAWRWATPLPNREAREFQPRGRMADAWRSRDKQVKLSELVGLPELNRPDDVPQDWAWVPFFFRSPEMVDGGEWVEPEGTVTQRYQEACAQRKGYCGLVGLGDEP